MLTLNATDVRAYDKHWQVRADRAIVASLLHTHGLLRTRRQTLMLIRQTLCIQAAPVFKSDPKGAQRLCALVADYYRADGELLRLGQRLGSRIDRQVSYAASPSSEGRPGVVTRLVASSNQPPSARREGDHLLIHVAGKPKPATDP